jgi:tRNA(Ile)-lysidine synthetase-like protein
LALTVRYDVLTVGDTDDAGPPPEEPLLWRDEPLAVQVPGTTVLPQSAWVLRVDLLAEWDLQQVATNPDPWTVYLDADALAAPVVLRPRCRGDRFLPQGMEGHSVKLSAFFVNRKLPRTWRDRVPLLVAGGEIVWVCGQRVGEEVAVGAETHHVAKVWFECV